MIKLFALILVCSLMTGCARQQASDFEGSWEITRMRHPALDGLTSKMTKENVSASAFLSTLETGGFFTFNEDGTFGWLQMGRFYTCGTWRFDADHSTLALTIVHSDTSRSHTSLRVKDFGGRKLVLEEGSQQRRKLLQVEYELEAVHSDKLKAYMSSNANAWRVKPSHSESVDAIKQRLIGSIQFAILFLQARKTTLAPQLIDKRMHLPFDFNGDTVRLVSSENISPEWKNIFYNEGDVLTAYLLLEQTLTSLSATGVHSFTQVQQFLKGVIQELPDIHITAGGKFESSH